MSMDKKLVAWARAVKSRHRGAGPPPLWLFTDRDRMGDLVAAVRGLPAGLCGVVFRHDGAPGRMQLARQVATVCRRRRLRMVLAGEAIALAGVGLHRRGGWGWGGGTASAHGVAELVRGRRSGAYAVFLSPVFPTRTHAGTGSIGMVRWSGMAQRLGQGRGCVLALGGIDGMSVRRLPRWVAGVGAIGALVA